MLQLGDVPTESQAKPRAKQQKTRKTYGETTEATQTLAKPKEEQPKDSTTQGKNNKIIAKRSKHLRKT